MTARQNALVNLAQLMGLSVAETVALPTVIEVTARKVGMAESALIAQCERNAPLRSYLRGICAVGAAAL